MRTAVARATSDSSTDRAVSAAIGGWGGFRPLEISPHTTARAEANPPTCVSRSSPKRGWSSAIPAASGRATRPGAAPPTPPVRPAAAPVARAQKHSRPSRTGGSSRHISSRPATPGAAMISRAAGVAPSATGWAHWLSMARSADPTAQAACHRARAWGPVSHPPPRARAARA
ncbi:hypothetical protein MU852_05745 [Brevundimonas albigilva]|uniref:hypothetical protein n=1 Tax=Brevundimonas albigilva TaxID=1312364 RepID=UPI00201B68CE|nr:hypothetical protein [Brevundimonas albigilva]UQV19302.1 hypothetical protein MU852_05745 [Brevundimonas albigilva]